MYSIISIIPLVIMYTLLGIFLNQGQAFELRNGADVLIRQFFSIFGDYGEIIHIASLNLVVIGIALYNRELFDSDLNIRFLGLGIIEGLAWGLILVYMLNFMGHFLLSASPVFTSLENFYLSLGAGVYEEIVFRLFLLGGTLWVFKITMGIRPLVAAVLSVIISAVIFSLFHNVGEYSEPFTWISFTIRFGGGVFLGALYLIRGLGITVYTHVFYDLIVSSLFFQT